MKSNQKIDIKFHKEKKKKFNTVQFMHYFYDAKEVGIFVCLSDAQLMGSPLMFSG
jgi:hypothetical protein